MSGADSSDCHAVIAALCRDIMELGQQAYNEGLGDLGLALAELSTRHIDSRESRLRLAAFQKETGRPAEALKTLQSLVVDGGVPPDADLYVRIAQAEAELGRLDRAVTNFHRAILVGEGTPELWYRIASCHALVGNIEAANKIFSSDLTLPVSEGCETSTRVLRMVSDLSELTPPSGPKLPFVSTLSEEAISAARSLQMSSCEAVLFVSCDANYFTMFAKALARSLAENAGVPIGIHFHVLNPDDHAVRLMAYLRDDFGDSIVCTIDKVDLQGLSEAEKKSLYSCTRFLVLPDLLAIYQKPTIITDADQAIVGNLAGFLADARQHDVSLLLFPAQRANLLALLSATVCVANDTAKACEFFTAVRNYLLARMQDPQCLVWHLDQAALAAAYLASSDVDFGLLPASIVDQSLPPRSVGGNSLFWSITYSVQQNAAKLRSGDFRTYALS
jgi:tetratricopeptide (TPR) repeat protein